MLDVIVPVETVGAVAPAISVKSRPFVEDCHCIVPVAIAIEAFNVNVAEPVLQIEVAEDVILVADAG